MKINNRSRRETRTGKTADITLQEEKTAAADDKRNLFQCRTGKKETDRSLEPAGIYVHIPFCVRKCIYCDFLSFAGCGSEQTAEYFDALNKECGWLKRLTRLRSENPGIPRDMLFRDQAYGIYKWLENRRQSACGEQADGLDFPAEAELEEPLSRFAAEVLPADSLFIGGGTPSSVDPEYIGNLLEELPLTEEAEITMEANPGTVSREKLNSWRRFGINRLSMGVQSFHDRELSFLGRLHDRKEAVRGFLDARAAGFENISLDLMFGFPGQTMDSWMESLRTAVELEPDHLSFYSLQIEEGTPLYRMFRSGEIEEIPDELNREMYHAAVSFLRQNGYERYEFSSAARPGRECRHNLKYWKMIPYFGLGMGAHSLIGGVRYAAPEILDDYERMIGEMERTGQYFQVRGQALEVNSPGDSMSDYLFTGLRLSEGIDLGEFQLLFGVSFRERYGEVLQKHLAGGTMILKKDHLMFTEKGIDLSNNVLVDFV